MHTFNYIRAAAEAGDTKGGGVFTEDPAKVDHIVWQTRPSDITPEEDALAEALMAVFEAGAWELGACVSALNARGAFGPDGAAWTEETFTARLAELAALVDVKVGGAV